MRKLIFIVLSLLMISSFTSKRHITNLNGGNQNNNTIPEIPVCDQMGISLIDGLGDKI